MAELPREERNSTMGNKRVKDAPGKIPNTQYTEVKLRQAHKCSLAQADKQTSSHSHQQTSSGNRLGLSPEVDSSPGFIELKYEVRWVGNLVEGSELPVQKTWKLCHVAFHPSLSLSTTKKKFSKVSHSCFPPGDAIL